MRLEACFIIAFLGLSSARGDNLWQVRGPKIAEEAISIPASQFSEKQVIARCRAFLRTHPRDIVLRYFIATDAQDALRRLRGVGVTDVVFEGWRKAYLSEPPAPATAELVRVLNRASVRMRFANGRIIEKTLERGSAFEAHYQGNTVRLLEVAPARVNAPGGFLAEGVQLFVQTPHPWSLSSSLGFTRWLSGQIDVPRVEVSIEDGWWFVNHPSYPIYNRFLPQLVPPTFEEFKSHTRFYCEGPGGKCLQTGPARL